MRGSLARLLPGATAGVDDATRDAVVLAVRGGQLGAVLRFKQQGVPLGRLDDGKAATLLHVAAVEGQAEMLAFLLRQPEVVKRIDARDRAQRTALHFAAAIGSASATRLLLEARADHHSGDIAEWTPLHWAAYGDHAPTCQVLLAARADPGRPNVEGKGASDLGGELRNLLLPRDAGSGTCASAPQATPSIEGGSPAMPQETGAVWVAFQADSGRTYYWNRTVGETVWELPPGIAATWYGFRTQDGSPYYWCADTEQTVWELPRLPDVQLSTAVSPSAVAAAPTSSTAVLASVPAELVGEEVSCAAVAELSAHVLEGERLTKSAPTPPLVEPSSSLAGIEDELVLRQEIAKLEEGRQAEIRRLEEDISTMLAVEDELALTATIELARGILSESAITAALAQLQELRGRLAAMASDGSHPKPAAAPAAVLAEGNASPTSPYCFTAKRTGWAVEAGLEPGAKCLGATLT